VTSPSHSEPLRRCKSAKLQDCTSGAADASHYSMGKSLLAAALLLGGCAHHRGDAALEIANTLIAATVIALEVAQYQPPPQPLCDDDDGNPPHVCPGPTPPPPAR